LPDEQSFIKSQLLKVVIMQGISL